jgi:uncharacterized protein (DUF885 family)
MASPANPSPVEALAREMLETSVRRSPSWGTDLGLHQWDHEVADPSRARVAEDVALHEAWLARADALGAHARGMPLQAQVDLDALRHALRLWLFEEREVRTWERNPDLAMEFLDHVFGLLVKDVLPIEERCAAIASRLAQAPRFLLAGRDRFDACPALWVEMALESAAGAGALLEAAEQLAMAPGVNSATRERVRAAAKEAQGAFAAHVDWLKGLQAKAQPDGWALGGARFGTLVGLRALGADADGILAEGHRLVAKLREDTRRAAAALLQARGIAPAGDPVRQAQETIEADHPADWAAVLASYRTSIAASRDFVQSKGLAALPPGERLEVVETPAYLRHVMPFAAYVSPGRFEAKQVGIYLVTPRDPKEFPAAEVLNTTVHEGYPGHHLQLSAANRNPSLARLFVHATETIEGWAHYCEETMLGHGFTQGASPEAVRYVVLKDQLWRACRIVIDVELHRGGMTFDQGWQMLRDVARMGEPQARAEVKRYTQSPAYQLSYLWGKQGIQRLREDAARAGMGERAFHDAFLGAGSLPLGLMRRALGLPGPTGAGGR